MSSLANSRQNILQNDSTNKAGILLNNVSANTDLASATAYNTRKGPATIVVRGDEFGGGTVTIYIASKQDPQQRYAAISGGAFTANGNLFLNNLPYDALIKATLTGAGTTPAPSNVFASIEQ